MVAVVVLAVAGVGAWLVSSWLGTYRQAQTTATALTTLRAAIAAEDWGATAGAVGPAQDAAERLAGETGAGAWRLLSALPWIGPTAEATHALAEASADVLAATEPLTPYAQRIARGELRREDGAFDVAGMAEVAPLLTRLSVEVDSAITRLDGIDTAAVRPEVGGPVEELRTALAQGAPAVSTAAAVGRWVPGLLGADGARDWLVLLQNPAEVRGAGGFVGGYVVVRADDGRLSIVRTGTSTEIANEPIPSGGAPADARLLWGDALERWGAFNVSPHFPTTAVLAQAGMAAMGTPVDGVVAVDPAGVAALLAVTGPVTADGFTIDADNAEQFFTADIYRQITDNTRRDEVSMHLVTATFDALLDADWEPAALADAIRASVGERNVQVWSARPDEEAWLAGTSVGGVLPNAPGSVVAVALNNTAENKTDAFVELGVDYAPGRCPTTMTQSSRLTVRLANRAPADLPRVGDNYNDKYAPGADPGETVELVHIYAPVGANFGSSTIDGRPAPLYLGTERNRPVWWTYLPLARGQERTIDVRFEEPTILGVEPQVRVQPLVVGERVTIVPDSDCRPTSVDSEAVAE